MNFLEQFQAANRVSTPLVTVRTFDSKSTIDSIKGLYKADALPPMILWDAVNGLRPITKKASEGLRGLLDAVGVDQGATPVLPEALRALGATNKDGMSLLVEDTIIFISNAQLFWAEAQVIQGIWNVRDIFKANGSMLVLLCPQGSTLPGELAHDFLILDEPLPTVADLEKIVTDTYKFAKLGAPDAATIKLATDALIGLPAFPAEQSTAMCLNVKTGVLDINELWARKRQTINQTHGLTVWEGQERLDKIGGLFSVKEFLSNICKGNEAPNALIFIDEIEKAFAGTGTDTSGVKTELTGSMLSWMQDQEMDGIIFIGIPGVGKSDVAKGAGGTFGKPVIKFDLAAMQGSLVGQSGTQLRTAQAVVDAISGKRTLAIATCNSIGALPPELRRRFNLGIFFFDAPTQEERKGIWDIYRKRYNINAKDEQPNDNGWTGAEIKECCKKAYRLNVSLKEASAYIVPVTKSSADLIENLRRSSSGKYLSATDTGLYEYDESGTIVDVPAASGRRMKG